MIPINLKAPVICIKTIVINCPREKVWEILTDIPKWSSWQPDIHHPKLYGELARGTEFTWRTGGANIRSTLHTVTPYDTFGWTGTTFGMKAIHNWKLFYENGKTIVEVNESKEGILAYVFKGLFKKSLEKGMVRWLKFLKAECEK